MQAHPERAFCREHRLQRHVYDFRSLRRIARALGPCQDRYTALWHIERAAQDFMTSVKRPAPPARELKARLEALSAALEVARGLERELDTAGTLRLVWAATERGLKIQPDYLADLATVARDAAGDALGRKRKNEQLDNFIYQVSWIVKAFAGWHPAITYDAHYPRAPYGGRFFDVVTDCLEPVGELPANQALGKAIQRMLPRMDKLSA